MLRAHSVEQVRAAEAALMATLPDGALMQRAADGLAEILTPLVFEQEPASVLMLVGVGDNGGDALYAAARLAARGARVDLLVVDEDRVHAGGLRAASEAGARRVARPEAQRVVVDAVVGIGGRPGLREPAASWYEHARREGAYIVAVDVPSGVDVDAATLPASHVRANLTCTFGTYKPALLAGPAADAAGPDVATLVDIGLTPYLGEPALEAVEAADSDLVQGLLRPMFGPTTHKYTRGVVGVAAGSGRFAGAAQLCVRGAQAGLAGMVRFVGTEDLAQRVVDRCPEVVAHTDPQSRGRVQAWVVGPGGGDDADRQLQMACHDGVPVVVDADALRFLPERFAVPALLTPHAGELAQMLGTDRDSVEADPLAHASRAADRWSATVLLKGARTLVVTPGLPPRVNLSGTPWLATAGAGDVLAGLAGSLLAAGADPRTAGSVAAFVHGAAAVAANPGGPVTAGRVADAVPGVLAAMSRGELQGEHTRDWGR